ncbi:MAG: hypothetical protein ACK4PI_04400 [Tepidisphaerales bacterium]
MWVAFLLLLGVGPLVAAAMASSRTITELMYRGLTLVSLLPLLAGGVWGVLRTPAGTDSATVRGVQVSLVVLTLVAAAAAWATGSGRRLAAARWLSLAAGLLGVLAASHVLHDDLFARGTGVVQSPKLLAMSIQTLACVVTMGVVGLPPALLIAAGQGWTRALRRLLSMWVVVLAASAAGSIASVAALGGAVPLSGLAAVRWVLSAALLALAVRQWRAGGGAMRLPRSRRVVGGGVLLLVGWAMSLASAVVALLLLRATGWPL